MIFRKSQTNDLIHTTHSVQLDGATSVEATIKQAMGDLVVRGGSIDLMNGEFHYPEPLAPEIDYRVVGGVGKLSIDHRNPPHVRTLGRMHWQVAFNDAVPIALDVKRATGPTNLNLSALNLTALDLDHATGDTRVDLSGDHPTLGAVKLSSATGDLEANLSGRYSRLSRLKADAATGGISLDLSGHWESDLHARVEVATGDILLRLPGSVGVEVKVSAALSRTTAPGFSQEGKAFRNSVFGVAPTTMYIAIKAAVSNVMLETVGD